MSAVLLPGGAVPDRKVSGRPKEARALAWLVLLTIGLLELAALYWPSALIVSPLQTSVLFKQVTGYCMLGLMIFAMTFGWLRRLPLMAEHGRRFNEVHQLGGLLILVLLASHLGQSPKGFLLYAFHAMALGLGAGALRAVLGPKLASWGSMTLLALHIALACLVFAGVLIHLYFVYAYTS